MITMKKRKFLLSVALIGTLFISSIPSVNAQQDAAAMQAEIAELRALIQALVGNTGNTAPTPGVPNISRQQAREIALDLIGAGVAGEVMLFTEDGVLTFEVEIRQGALRHTVYVNAITGSVIRMVRQDDVNAVGTPAAPAVPATPVDTSGIVIGNVVPRPPARTGGPANPAISAQRAVELARDHLISIGIATARFDYIYMDIEAGQWVWSVEFDSQGRDLEFYINVQTGAFLQAPQATTPVAPVAPAPQATGGSAASPSPAAPSAASPSPASGQGNRPQNPAISLERAIELGHAELARRNLSGTFRNHSGMEWERGQWVWELVFRVPGGRLPLVEMYINVDNGNIVKFEWDD
ncbi:MAG: PepSY domain-containing protein [Firmicutes bacterium]|nr:PepSY domain-containing protein [Bacillota bacterium]